MRFDGKPKDPVHLKESKGLDHIHRALANRSQIVSWADLYACDRDAVKPRSAADSSQIEYADDGDKGGLARLARVYDSEGVKKLKKRLEEIAQERSEAERRQDEATIQVLDDEVSQIEKELEGSSRAFTDDRRQAGVNIKTNIRRACGRMPAELAHLTLHLSKNLNVGADGVIYDPDPPIDWET